jgi:signal peptidase I
MTDKEPTTPSKGPGLWRGWLRPFVLTLAALFVFRSVVLDWNVVPSGSMKPTILEGDYIVVNKLAFDLKVPFTGQPLLEWGNPGRGDIIVFTPPGKTERYVKRVVGVPGDVLELRDNELFVNGQRASYEPLDPGVYQDLPAQARTSGEFAREVVAGRGHPIMLHPDRPGPDSFEPLVVPPGHYFVMGDNRDNSEDSRVFGLVARERISGRVSVVALSLDPLRHRLPRWARFFHGLT